MNQRDLVVKIAQGEVGNVGGEKYWSWYGFDYHVQWCASFVSWVLAKAGVQCGDLRPYINKTDTPEEAAVIESFIDGDYDGLISKGCMQILEFYERKGWRLGDVPAQPGDIVLYEWDPTGPGAADGVDHVGFVETVEGDTPDTQVLHLIEGNFGGKVTRTTYRYRDARVWAIVRPNYAEGEIEEKPELLAAPFELAEGDEGREVQLVQYGLMVHGHDVGAAGIDGKFGPSTQTAVEKFQRNHDLSVDGIVGTETLYAMFGK